MSKKQDAQNRREAAAAKYDRERVYKSASSAGSASLEELIATVLMGRDWHRLSENERLIVERLESSGHLTPSTGGVVGYPPGKQNGDLSHGAPPAASTAATGTTGRR